MVTLTRIIGALVRWMSRSRRRQIAVLVLPLLAVIAIVAPRSAGSPPSAPRGQLAGSAPAGPNDTRGVPTATITPGTELPGTTGAPPGPTVTTRPAAVLPKDAAKVATDYVSTVNAHDARPGQDHGFLDSYVRARPYLTPELFAAVTGPSRRGDYEWAQWQRAQATVTVAVQRVAVPDGAPLPTAATAYVRVLYRQVVTPHAPGAKGAVQAGAVSLVTTKSSDGRWLVSKLLADT